MYDVYKNWSFLLKTNETDRITKQYLMMLHVYFMLIY